MAYLAMYDTRQPPTAISSAIPRRGGGVCAGMGARIALLFVDFGRVQAGHRYPWPRCGDQPRQVWATPGNALLRAGNDFVARISGRRVRRSLDQPEGPRWRAASPASWSSSCAGPSASANVRSASERASASPRLPPTGPPPTISVYDAGHVPRQAARQEWLPVLPATSNAGLANV